jgi:DNA repair exonuclease SbcCD ATPase subunit
LESHIEQLKKQLKELRDENDKTQKKSYELQEYSKIELKIIFHILIN